MDLLCLILIPGIGMGSGLVYVVQLLDDLTD